MNWMINIYINTLDLVIVYYKKQERTDLKKIVFDTDIYYYEPNMHVPEQAIFLMMAILLDYAMDASPSGKIINIYIHVTENDITLEVANVYSKKIFRNYYSTKLQDTHVNEHELSRLSQIVSEYGGQIYTKEKPIKEKRLKYLSTIIEFHRSSAR